MKRLKLKPYVLPTIYIISITTIIVSVLLVGATIRQFKIEPDVTYVVGKEIEENVTPVVEVKEDKVIKPFLDEGVSVAREFYEMDAKEETQKKALIYYEGTYMPSSGILYKSESEFEIIAVMDGIVANIKEDNLLGLVVEVDHSSSLTTVYQSLKETGLKVGDALKQGDVIGLSGSNNIDAPNKFELFFEVIHNGKLINPNNFYETNIKAYSTE